METLNLIVGRMFPDQDVDMLATLSREKLINLVVSMPAPKTSFSPASHTQRDLDTSNNSKASEGAESLAALEQAPPDQDPRQDSAKRYKDKVQAISDDVNGLSLAVDKPSSYVGISSITAALKVIFKTAPVARPFIMQTYSETALPSRANSPPLHAHNPDPNYLPPPDVGHKLIESYFAHIHVMMPMVDEEQIWHTYLYAERRDPPWLALLNMIFALGQLATSTCHNESHIPYFERARKHLDLEVLRTSNLLVLHALGLLSGYYLHWLNRPNEANCLMGATLRMATALGLHREYNDGQSSGVAKTHYNGGGGAEIPVEIRRRTWWSLYCLDTWAQMTTGRPSLGRMGPGITAQSPKVPDQMNNAQYLASIKLLPIIHNISFCKLATRIQDKLAGQSLLPPDELLALDDELVSWHDELPPILRDVVKRPHNGVSTTSPLSETQDSHERQQTAACPELLQTPRAIMHWWYQTLRMLMHRPYLLVATLRRSSFAKMTTEEKVIVRKCRIIAGQTIADIDSSCRNELIAGWNAVWLCYQATMVPLLSLFSYLSTSELDGEDEAGDRENVEDWRQQIELAMSFFDRMQDYSVAARKSKDVVERLYAASWHISQLNGEGHGQGPERSQQDQPFQSVGQLQVPLLQHTSHPGAEPGSLAAGNLGLEPLNFPFDSAAADPESMPEFSGQRTLLLSPSGDPAMNSFWNDMMWDTFPEMQDAPDSNMDTFLGFSQFDGQ